MADAPRKIGSTRRRWLGLMAVGATGLAGCDRKEVAWHETDVTGDLPPLALAMTDAGTNATVSAADFSGDVVLLTFGYTSCPDICPTTLGNLATVLHRLGRAATSLRVLFVTVDPGRDDVATLRAYTALFAPQIVGLRGTPDALARLARRYRVAYSVQPGKAGQPPEVSHSSLIYVFDRTGATRLLVSSLATPTPDIDGLVADLRRLTAAPGGAGPSSA